MPIRDVAADPRGGLLRAFDAHRRDFEALTAHGERGGANGAADVERLVAIARRIAADAEGWRRAAAGLEFASARPLRPGRAAALVAETVFDEILTPAASRVLMSALDLIGCEV